MLEGYKAYLLPALAGVLLLGYFILRPDPDAVSQDTKAEPTKPKHKASRREQIDAAISDAGASAPPLPDGYGETIAAALQPLVDRCRKPRPDDAEASLAVHVDAAAADGVGGFVRNLTISAAGSPSASDGFIACVEEGLRPLKLPDAGATGNGTYDLEIAP